MQEGLSHVNVKPWLEDWRRMKRDKADDEKIVETVKNMMNPFEYEQY